MKIHEYQGKQIFARYGVPIPKGYPASSTDEVEKAAKKLIDETGSPVVVVKAQIHAGGRGKGGGVKVVKGGASEARKVADSLLGMMLITHQTGPSGQKVRRLYVEQGLDIAPSMAPRANCPVRPSGVKRCKTPPIGPVTLDAAAATRRCSAALSRITPNVSSSAAEKLRMLSADILRAHPAP